MDSCIYRGSVRHRRTHPVANQFEYRLFMMFIDLDELPDLFDDRLLWSVGKRNVASFRRANYFGSAEVPLREAVAAAVQQQLGVHVDGPIRMLTHLEYCGHCFNPVTFYYCYGAAGEIKTIVADITNTPWGDRHAYFLDTGTTSSASGRHWRFRFPKTFHVSPFMPMGVDYDWRFSQPAETLNVHMIDNIDGRKHFDATLRLRRQAMTQRNLAAVLVNYPLMTLRVVAGIHWQALRLWAKRATFYPRP